MMLVPMYSLNSWAAIYWTSSAYIFNCGRECYEAYVLYSLGKLLLEFLDFSVSGSLDEARTPGEALTAHLVQRARSREAALEAAAASQGGGAAVPAPAREAAWRTHIGLLYMALPEGGAPAGSWRALLPRYLMEPAWRVDTLVTNVRLAVFQYVVVRCGCAGLTLLTAYLGVYCEGSLNPACSWPWIFAAVSASQFTAACWVFVLYAEFHDELAPLNPLVKILSIKFVLFLSFWQSAAISLAQYTDVVHGAGGYSGDEVAGALQNYLICWELALVAVAHHYVFNRRELKACQGAAHPALPLLAAPLSPNDAFLRHVMPVDLQREAGEYAAAAGSYAAARTAEGRDMLVAGARKTRAKVAAGVAAGMTGLTQLLPSPRRSGGGGGGGGGEEEGGGGGGGGEEAASGSAAAAAVALFVGSAGSEGGGAGGGAGAGAAPPSP